MAFQTVWSVDLGKSSLKAVKLRRDRNNVEILAVDKVDYPLSKNGVDAATQAKEALGIFVARNAVKEPVVVAHPGQGTFYRSIKVPASDDKKVDAMVGFEASQQIPFPLDEVVWDYHVVRKEYLPGEERDVALFAVRREAMDDFLLDFASEDLKVEMVSIGYLGLLNFVLHDIAPEEPSIVLDIGAAHTDLLLVDGSRFWIRPLPHSGSDVTKAIASRFKLSFPEAEKLKLDSSKVPKQAVKIFQAVIQPKLKELVGEIHRSIGFYRSQAGEVRFKHLYVLGNGAKIVGIKKFLEEQLGVQVHRVQSINRFRVNRDVDIKTLQAHLPSFSTALGCGLQGLEAASCDVDLVPKEEKLRKEFDRKKRHVFIAAAILLVAMVATKFLIEKRIGDAQPALLAATKLDSNLKGWKKEFDSLDPNQAGGTLAKALELEGFAKTRSLVFLGLKALEDAVGGIDMAPDIVVEEIRGETTKRDASRDQYLEQLLPGMVWVPSVQVKSIRFADPSFTTKEAEIETNSVPAVTFQAVAVVKMAASNAASQALIRDRVADRIERVAKALSPFNPKVEVTGGQEVGEIYKPEKAGQTLIEQGQEGGPFYSAVVSWTLLSGEPPKKKGGETE